MSEMSHDTTVRLIQCTKHHTKLLNNTHTHTHAQKKEKNKSLCITYQQNIASVIKHAIRALSSKNTCPGRMAYFTDHS